MTKKPIVFSGIQPSGDLHLANYIGAISHWVSHQEEKESFFCIVDLHAITTPQDPKVLKKRIRDTASWLLAAGLDPAKVTLFVQSQNSDHAQLTWILDCVASVGQLRRMTQFKEKGTQQKDAANMGLLNYPILMAADILLYNATDVPVGSDQKQHVELARDIAERFNFRFGETFVLPEPRIAKAKEGARIKSLQNPASKMSKSDDSSKGLIYLHEEPDSIRSKIKSAVTDSGAEVRVGEDKPALTNLITIYSACANLDPAEIEKKYRGKSYGEFKEDLAEVVVKCLGPMQERFREISANPSDLDKILVQGLEKAREVSGKTLRKVEKAVGLGV